MVIEKVKCWYCGEDGVEISDIFPAFNRGKTTIRDSKKEGLTFKRFVCVGTGKRPHGVTQCGDIVITMPN